MSEPITLTERERAVFDALAEFLAESSGTVPSLIGRYIFDWLAIQPMESASPPRVPIGITGPVLPYESGPGQPIDGAEVTLEECPPGLFFFGDDNHLGFKSEYSTTQAKNGVVQCDAYVVSSGEYFWGGASSSAERAVLKVRPVDAVAAIRALADKPAPEPKETKSCE